MMLRISSVLLLVFLHYGAIAQGNIDTLQARIILIGDAGEFNSKGQHPVVRSVKEHFKFDKKTTILYLGDNLYKAGLPDEQNYNYSKIRAVLDTQINIARGSGAKVYFIPGNHDWAEYGVDGWETVKRQQYYIDALGDNNVSFYPQEGCPGPVLINVTNEVVMILLDSQWWLHKFEKPGIESDCDFKTKEQVLGELNNLLNENSKKLVIIAMHHPMRSYGIHGGNFSLKQAFFPLTDIRKNLYIPFPLIGFAYPIARGVFGTPQDIKHPTYANMITEIDKVAQNHKNVIFVAGHEHTQQLISDSGHYYIVSGAGAKESRVDRGPKSLFVSDTTGFATLEISKNRNVKATFFNVKDNLTEAKYEKDLLNFSPVEDKNAVPIVFVPYGGDSVTIAANTHYNNASKVKRFFNGDNYRTEWATPVTMPVFRLKESGFTIKSLGGGKQTKTLTLTDSKKKEWFLRTIDKDLDNLLPGDFRGTAAQNYLSDFVSSAHPYAPLIVPDLAKAAEVVVAKPKFYFVPNDQAFGMYRSLFANKLVLLEEKEPTPDGADSKTTAKLVNKLLDDNEHHVEQVPVLKARLLDVLLADWNRHMDQWRFGEKDTGQGKLYYPMPRDRDEALSNSNGLIAKILASNYMPWFSGFKNKINGFKWQAYESKEFDRLFLNSIEEDEWKKIITEFQKNVTDQVIHEAVMKLPPPIYAIRGSKIEQTLRARRQNLMKEGMDYYHFLAKEVNISGTNQRELFKVTKAGNQIQVRVYKRNSTSDSLSIMYNRKFDKATKEIRFFGLGKDDRFEVDEDVSSKILLRFIGGKGNDTFNIKGHVKNFIYDRNTDSNYVENGRESKIEFTDNLKVNEYSTVYKYDRSYFPTINVGYNIEDGPLAGFGFSRKKFGFRKEPYASEQRLSTLYAFNNRSFQAKYRGDFVQVFGKNGLLIKADYVTPVLNNFYGLGNVTNFDLNQSQQFNRVRYNYTDLDVLLTKRSAGGNLIMGAGAHFYHYWNNPEDNAGKILSRPALIGLDSASVYQSKTYGGLKGILQFSNANNDLFPTRGVVFSSEINSLAALRNGRPITSIKADFTLYSSLNEPARIVTVTRMGFGHIFNNNYEYFQAMNLGQNNFLRGFRKNRFSGRSMAYVSLEARIKLLDSKSYFLPGSFGLIAFDDVGRVWVKNEDSKRWHNSVGGGMYYAAYNTILISGTIGFSREENLLNFSIGTKFNLNF